MSDESPDESEAEPDAADGGREDGATEEAFAAELERARELLADGDLTAFHVGVVRAGDEVETTFSHRSEAVGPEREGIQTLTLLATHLRVVADEAGVDRETVAADAAALAGRVEETEGTVADVDADGG